MMSTLDDLFTDGDLPPSRHKRTWGRYTVVTALAFGLMVLGFFTFQLLSVTSEPNDYVGSGTGSVVITVSRGDSLTAIAGELVDANVIKSKDPFLSAAALDEASTRIGPGKYTLKLEMSGSDALALMLDPVSRSASRLVLPEGLRMPQTLNIASETSGISLNDFDAAIETPSDLPLPSWADSRPQGFMFPATYDLVGDESAQAILDTLVLRFNQASADISLEQRAAELGLSPYEVLTIASLIQAELLPADFAKGAAVIYNRLKADMPLQFDSTVLMRWVFKSYNLILSNWPLIPRTTPMRTRDSHQLPSTHQVRQRLKPHYPLRRVSGCILLLSIPIRAKPSLPRTTTVS